MPPADGKKASRSSPIGLSLLAGITDGEERDDCDWVARSDSGRTCARCPKAVAVARESGARGRSLLRDALATTDTGAAARGGDSTVTGEGLRFTGDCLRITAAPRAGGARSAAAATTAALGGAAAAASALTGGPRLLDVAGRPDRPWLASILVAAGRSLAMTRVAPIGGFICDGASAATRPVA